MHAHTLPWVDVPLVMKNFLGGEEGLNDSGVSVSKLLLNPLFFLEATGELYQGNSGPFQTHERSDVSWLGRCAAIATSPRHQPRRRRLVHATATTTPAPIRRRGSSGSTRPFATGRSGGPSIAGSWAEPN